MSCVSHRTLSLAITCDRAYRSLTQMPMFRTLESRAGRVARTARLAISIAMLLARPLAAQIVQGNVRSSGTPSAPVSGAVVSLIDSTGASIARALTGADGDFRLAAPRAGLYRVRTARIGFTPQVSAPIMLTTGESRTLPLALNFISIDLDTLRVAAQSPCRVERNNSGTSAFQVWDQVRTALSATALTTADQTFELTTLKYEREYAAATTRGGRRIDNEQRSMRREQGMQPWRSAPIAQLRRYGYVVEQADGSAIYYAPDLDGLLAPSFLEDHCIKLVAGRDSTEVGVSFEPTRDRILIPEIAGTMYVARGTARLRAMTYRYVQLPPLRSSQSGGTLEFVALRTGAWLIRGWEIYMPAMEKADPRSLPYLAKIQASGGELMLAIADHDTLYSRPAVRFTGTVVDSLTRQPVANAYVRIGADSLRANERGEFSLPARLPGLYAATVRTPALDSLGLSHREELALIDSTSALRVYVPPAASVVLERCGIGPTVAMLNGFVRSTDGTPVRSQRVTLEWNARPINPLAPPTNRNVFRLPTTTDSAGAFSQCGQFAGAMLRVQAVTSTGRSLPQELVVPTETRAQLVVLTVDPTQSPVSRLRGRVVSMDSGSGPILDAEVMLRGAAQGVRTSANGEFLLDTVPVGVHVVQVRRLGYTPISATVTFRVGIDEEAQFALGRVRVLDSVRVEAEAAIPSFEENRKQGLGQFFTRAQLAQLENRSFSAALTNFRGTAFVQGKTTPSVWLVSGRGPKSVSGSTLKQPDGEDLARGAQLACYARIILDNTIMYYGRDREPLFDLRSINASQLEAVEYYSGPSETPSQYAGLNTNCGVLVMWTRRTFDNKAETSKKHKLILEREPRLEPD